MQNILSTAGTDNQGGLQEVYFTDQANLAAPVRRTGLSVVGDVVLKPGAVWYVLRGTLDTAGFDQAFTDDRNGGLYAAKLAGFVASDAPALAQPFFSLRNKHLVLLYRDANGRLKLAGDESFWYTCTYRFETKNTAAGRAGYSFEFVGRAPRPALFYFGAFTVAQLGTMPATPAPAPLPPLPAPTPTPLPGGTSDHEALDNLYGGEAAGHWHVTKAMFDLLNAQLFQSPALALAIAGTPAPQATGYYKRGVDTVTNVRTTVTANKGSLGAVTASSITIPPAAAQNFTGLLSPNPHDFAVQLQRTTLISASVTFGSVTGHAAQTLTDSKQLGFAYAMYYGPSAGVGPVDLNGLQELVAPFGNSRTLSLPLLKGQKGVVYLPGTTFIRAITDQNGFDALGTYQQTAIKLTQGRDAGVDYIELMQTDYATVDNTSSYTFAF